MPLDKLYQVDFPEVDSDVSPEYLIPEYLCTWMPSTLSSFSEAAIPENKVFHAGSLSIVNHCNASVKEYTCLSGKLPAIHFCRFDFLFVNPWTT